MVSVSIFCSAPALPRPSSYLIYPHPSTLRLRLYLQTSVHRCLPLLTTTKLTKKLEKARKTRPFIDSLVEGSRPQLTPRTHPPTSPHLKLHLIHLTRAHSRRIANRKGHATDLAHTVLSTLTHLVNPSDKRTLAFFSLSLPHPEHRASHFAHFVSFSRQQSQDQALSRPRAIHHTRHHHDQPTDARTVSLDSHV